MKLKASTTTTPNIAAQFKALGHPARVQILQTLAKRESCVCGEIVEVLGLAQSTVSQHLKVLKQAGLIQGTIDGPRSCYCINRAAMAALKTQAVTAIDSWIENKPNDGCC